jgi:hypothetical protein
MLPTLLGLPPKAEFADVVRKVNQLVQELTNVLLNLDSLNVVSLTADHIDAGTIDASLVTIRSILNAGAFIRIDGNGMTVNNGTNDVFTVDINGFVTLTGALFRSSASAYPRVDIDPSGTPIISVSQSLGNTLDIISTYSGGSPAITLRDGGSVKAILQRSSPTEVLLSTLGATLQIVSASNLLLGANGGGNISVVADGSVNLAPVGNLEINGTPGWTGSYNDGTNTITVVKGIITSVV